MTVFVAFATEFMWRYFTDAPVPSHIKSSSQITLSNGRRGDYTGAMRLMVYALAIATVMLYIRYVVGSLSYPTHVLTSTVASIVQSSWQTVGKASSSTLRSGSVRTILSPSLSGLTWDARRRL